MPNRITLEGLVKLTFNTIRDWKLFIFKESHINFHVVCFIGYAVFSKNLPDCCKYWFAFICKFYPQFLTFTFLVFRAQKG